MLTSDTIDYSDDPRVTALAGLVITLLKRLGRAQIDELLAELQAQADSAGDDELWTHTPRGQSALDHMGLLLQRARHQIG